MFPKLVAASLLLFCFNAVAGCNAVLGIEPAELDDTIGAASLCPSQSHQTVPNTDCTPCSEDAQSQCKVAECLADHECRKSLRAYRKCLGQACEDEGSACRGCATDKKAAALVACLQRQGCSAAAPTTVCEEYCACMAQECPDTSPDGNSGIDGCLAACEQGATVGWQTGLLDEKLAKLWSGPQPSWRPYCLWEHCELAGDGAHSHCGHAIGRGDWCKDEPKEDTSAPKCAAGKSYGNYPCNVNDDCCSGECDPAQLACTRP